MLCELVILFKFYRRSHTAKDGDCSSGKNGRTLGKGFNGMGPRQERPKGPTEGSLWVEHPLLVALSINIFEIIYI